MLSPKNIKMDLVVRFRPTTLVVGFPAYDRNISASDVALLRLVYTYPWLLKVADADF